MFCVLTLNNMKQRKFREYLYKTEKELQNNLTAREKCNLRLQLYNSQ